MTRWLRPAACLLLAGAFVLPFYWLLATSLKTEAQIFADPPVWIPWPPHWANYTRALAVMPFPAYARNTLVVGVVSSVGQVVASSLVAYGFARLRWPGRDALFVLVLSTMMLPHQVTMVPLYVIFRKLGWLDSLLPLYVPSLFGHAFNIFLFRQFFLTIPRELSDAARIDGCGDLAIYRRIVMPLSRPVIVTVALLDFLYNWNDLERPLIYIQRQENYTLSLGLQAFGGFYGPNLEPATLMAAAAIVALPAVLLFLFAQRFFVRGITLTGLAN